MTEIDPAVIASVYLNSALVIMVGAACAWWGLSRFFNWRHKRSVVVFWVYMTAKCLFWSYYDVLLFFGLDGGMTDAAWATLFGVLGIVTYAVIYVCWNSSLLKLGLVAMLIDIVSGLCAVVGMAIASLLFGEPLSFDYVGCVRTETFVSLACQAVLFVLAIRIFVPLGRYICRRQFKYEQLWLSIWTLVVVIVASSKISGVDATLLYVLIIAIVLLLVLHVIWRGREERRRQAKLARANALMRTYDDALRSQVAFLANSRSLLDELSDRIDSADDGSVSTDMLQHVEALRETCNRLRFGVYTDSPALDIALVSYESRFRDLGVKVDYSIAPLTDRGSQIVPAVQALFEWAVQICKDSGFAQSQREDSRKIVRLRVFRRANLILVEAKMPFGARQRFPKSWIKERVPSSWCLVRDLPGGEGKAVRVIVEEDSLCISQ